MLSGVRGILTNTRHREPAFRRWLLSRLVKEFAQKGRPQPALLTAESGPVGDFAQCPASVRAELKKWSQTTSGAWGLDWAVQGGQLRRTSEVDRGVARELRGVGGSGSGETALLALCRYCISH